MSFDAADGAGSSNVAGDTELLPIRITGLKATSGHCFRFLDGYFIIRHHNAATMTTVLGIKEIDCMKGSSRSGEEIYDERIRFACCKQPDSILYGI